MSSKTQRLLVVDDVADNAFLLKALLESEGYSIEVADSGSLALEMMRTSLPDLVLLDVMMPGMDGYELTRAIRRDGRLRSVPVVLITAYDEMCRIKGIAIGASDFVRKPIKHEELLAKIQNLLRFRGARN